MIELAWDGDGRRPWAVADGLIGRSFGISARDRFHAGLTLGNFPCVGGGSCDDCELSILFLLFGPGGLMGAPNEMGRFRGGGSSYRSMLSSSLSSFGMASDIPDVGANVSGSNSGEDC